VSGSWQGETAHRWAQLRLEQTDPRPNNPAAWMATLCRTLLRDRPETLRLLEADGRTPVAAAFWLIDHPTQTTATTGGRARDGADFNRLRSDCDTCQGVTLVIGDTGAVPCPDCRTEAVA